MSKKLHMKPGHMKVLAKDGLKPYFSVNCPCQQEPLTGKWFIDYYSYYQRNLTKLELYNFPNNESIPQTNDIQRMQTRDPNWYTSTLIVTQPFFYRANIWSERGLNDPRTEVYYRTKELQISGNNFILNQQMYKEQNWWDYMQGPDEKFVSGNSTSAVSYNYCLSTNCEPFTISQSFITEQSGFISTLIINNVDNEIDYNKAFITGFPIDQYSIKVPNRYSYPYIVDPENNWYILINNKSYAVNQFYSSRVYKGSQYGYVYTFIEPSLYYYGLGYNLVYNEYTMCGDDDPPIPGKVVYFRQVGTELYYVRKIGNKYYGLYPQDKKTIVEFPSTDITSAVIQYDQPSIVKITTGLVVTNYDNINDQWLLSSTDGLMLQDVNGDLIPIDQFRTDQYMGQTWSNYYYTVGQWSYYTTKIYGQSGQYFLLYSYDRETIDDVDYYWWYYVCFPKEYDSITSTATMNVYKFGEDQTNGGYVTGFVTSTTILTSYVYQWYEEGEPPATHWDTQLSCFYYPSGTAANNHPDYLDLYIDVYHLTPHDPGGPYDDTQRFYIYKAPAWAGIKGFTYDRIRYNTSNSVQQTYIITGTNYNNVRVMKYSDSDEFLQQITPSAGWWVQYDDISNNYICLVLSGQDWWYVDGLSSEYSQDYFPLTGGTLFDPQKSIAADDPNRPPYWFFPYRTYHANILSGKYFIDDQSNDILPITPMYYDTYFGHPVNFYSINDGVFECWNSYDQPYNPNSGYYIMKEMVNNYAYSYCNPFIKYIETEYYYVNDALGQNYTDNPTLAQYFQLYKDPDYPFTGIVQSQIPMYEPNDYGPSRDASWGGDGGTPGYDYNYRIRTQRFKKITAQQIRDANLTRADYVDKSLSAALALQTGIYCQILTGFWLRNKYDERDYYNNIRGIRKNGVFYAVLDFNTEYHFGYDLSNTDQLNDLLSNDNSVCYKSNGSGGDQATTVAQYWADLSSNLQPTTNIQDADYSKFWSYCYIRPISGVFGLS